MRNRTRRVGAKLWILEATWIVVPLVLTMVMFLWGAAAYFEQRTMPANAIELKVVGKQWMWKIQHPQGRSEINELHVPLGQPVLLRMISEDVIHSFYMPAFRVKMDVLPRRYTSLWFEATRAGRVSLVLRRVLRHGTCRHARPRVCDAAGRVCRVAGRRRGAAARHRRRGAVHAASAATRAITRAASRAARRSPTCSASRCSSTDGQIVTADEAYLRESI